MAVSGSYKQECPSCEAMVLIKDRALVGKKIDCPQCKYRFVVEAPKGEAPAAGEAPAPAASKGKPKPEQAVTSKKPPGATAGPSAPKKRAKQRFGDDDEEEPIGPEPEKASSKTVVVGVGLSVLAVVLLGVGAYFAFFSGGDDKQRGTGPLARNSSARTPGPTTPTGPGLVEITNLLPGESQAVVGLNVKALRKSTFGGAAFDAPGAFNEKVLGRQLGLPIADIERALLAANAKKEWSYAVLRTSKPVDLEAVKAALGLKPGPDSVVLGQDYLVGEASPWQENMRRFLGEMLGIPPPAAPVNARPLAFRLVDSHTLVVADLEPMKELLAAKGQLPHKSKPGPAAKGAQPASARYLTIEPALKAVLDRIDADEASLVSVALDVSTSTDAVKGLAQHLVRKLGAGVEIPQLEQDAEKMLQPLGDVRAVGASLQFKEKMILVIGLDGKTPDTAKTIVQELRSFLQRLAFKQQMDKAGFLIVMDGGTNIGQKGGDVPRIDLNTVRLFDTTFAPILELPTAGKGNILQKFQGELQPLMVGLRAATDMAAGRSRLHDLGAAVKELAAKEKQFPRGAFERPPSPERLDRDWRPNQRISWMAALLPYLGDDSVAKALQKNLSWMEDKNVALGGIIVPAFLDARYPPPSRYALVERIPSPYLIPYGATHFVGIAGVGMEAADYKADDAAVAKKIGILGYDRVTKVEDIKDQLASTILMIQVPWQFQRPWIAGGGATLMGVPEKDSIKQFVCVPHDDKPGTYAIMGNGDVRFIPATISDEAFQGLCAINGDKKGLDETTLLPPPLKPVLKAQP